MSQGLAARAKSTTLNAPSRRNEARFRGGSRIGFDSVPERARFDVKDMQATKATLQQRPDATAIDWRTAIPEQHRRSIRTWLWSIAAMTFGIIVIGGITRLTLSGLSIVEWRPFTGVIPPLSEAEWLETFELYKQYPEYQTWRTGMTLAEFKFIFFWEYVHRLVARLIGVVFLVPFIWFWLKGRLTPPLRRRALALFGLGAAQGLMGWLMVMSGLVDRPSVSHYRLAAHFVLALTILGYATWLALELRIREARTSIALELRSLLKRGLAAVGVLLTLQVVWGAFTAGLKAGHFYPTFPLMGGALAPPDLLRLEPALRNFVDNPPAVQWTHRVIGTLLALAIVTFAVRVFRRVSDPVSRRYAAGLLAIVLVQYLLGVLTVINLVPISLGVAHQAVAAILVLGWLGWVHHVHNLQPAAG